MSELSDLIDSPKGRDEMCRAFEERLRLDVGRIGEGSHKIIIRPLEPRPVIELLAELGAHREDIRLFTGKMPGMRNVKFRLVSS